MVIDNLLPVFALILLGSALKRVHLVQDLFFENSDRLIYFIFFPAMLFWKIGGAPTTGPEIDWNLSLGVSCALLVVYLFSAASIKIFHIGKFQAGAFSQSCYRFNTYIGMAIILNALGEEGVRHFGILIGFAIPLINVLAVSTLIWYSGRRISASDRIRMTARALVSNPLIIACLAGIVYARTLHRFPIFLDSTFRLMSLATLPLALLSIGNALTFNELKGHLRLSLIASLIKMALFPAVGYAFLRWFSVTGVSFQVGMIFFTLPTSTAIYVLSSQLNSDTKLASASIVFSTAVSFLSLSFALIRFF